MAWGLTYLAYPRLKIMHCTRQVHSNINPLSCLQRRMPFLKQPASNDPDINLSQEENIDFYGWMKWKFNIRMSSLITQTEDYHPITFEINLPNEHLLESFSHFTSAKMETFLHTNPEDVKAILKGYEEDLHFTNIICSFPIKPPFNFKNYHQNKDRLIFFSDQSGKERLCVPSSMWHNLMEEIHGSLTGAAHVGFERTYGCIANGSFWPGITRDIHKFLSTCPLCQKIKHVCHLPYGLLQLIPILMQWFEVVTMDFIGELPKSQVSTSSSFSPASSPNMPSPFLVQPTLQRRRPLRWYRYFSFIFLYAALFHYSRYTPLHHRPMIHQFSSISSIAVVHRAPRLHRVDRRDLIAYMKCIWHMMHTDAIETHSHQRVSHASAPPGFHM